MCNPPCRNGGNCTSPDECVCPEGWRGYLCDERKHNIIFCIIVINHYVNCILNLVLQLSVIHHVVGMVNVWHRRGVTAILDGRESHALKVSYMYMRILNHCITVAKLHHHTCTY